MVAVDDVVLRDPARVAAVDRARGALSGVQAPLNAVAGLVARLFDAPMAVVTLVGDQQEYFVGVHALPAALVEPGHAPLAYSVCKYMVSADRPVRCDDMRGNEDPQLREHPLATRYGVRAFLGVPLRDREDRPVGSLTVLDPAVRQWSDRQVTELVEVAELLQPSLRERPAGAAAPAGIDGMSLLDGVQEAFLAVDRSGVVVGFNRAAQEMLGFTDAEVCGRHLDASLLPDFDGKPVATALACLFTVAPHRPVLRTVRVRHRDGHWLTAQASLSVVSAEAGLLACVFLADVSAQAAAEEAAERNGHYLAALLDSLSVGVIACDEHGHVVLANRAMRAVRGLPAAGPLPADFAATTALVHPDLTPISWDQTPLMRALRGEYVRDMDVVVRVPGHRLRTFASTAQPITTDDGRRLGAVVVAHEMTSVRRVENFRACHLAVTRALATATSPRAAAPAVARAVATTLGWPYAELWLIDTTGERLESIGHWTAPGCEGLHDFTVVKGVGVTGRVWATGQPLWVADIAAEPWLHTAQLRPRVEVLMRSGIRTVLSVPVSDGDTLLGVLTGYASAPELHEDQLTVLLDGVAAQFGAFVAMRRAAQLRHQLQRAQDDFLALVGHELRTPLTSIAANTAMLAGDAAALPDDDRQMVQSIERNTAALQNIVDTLLDLAGMDSGHIGLTVRRIDLAALTAQATAAAEPLATGNRVRISADLPEPLMIDGDPIRLRQVLDDLLSNAVKYSPNGGDVHLDLRHDADMADLTIIDEGIGVPAGELGHLFDRFYRGSNVRHHGTPGNGLGLSRARTIVHLHAGTITVTDHRPSGTAVAVRLPLRHPNAQS